MHIRPVLTTLLLGAAACGPAEVPPAAEAPALAHAEQGVSPWPVLTFHDDWTINQSAPLVAGQPALLRYELGRLPACRGLHWQVSAFFTSEHTHRRALYYPGVGTEDALELHFTVPFGNDVQFWFQGMDSNGCSQWDSNWGQNFRVAVQNPTPTVHFRSDWTTVVDGTLRAGGPIHVDFDIWRIPFCNAVTQYDTFTGDAFMYYRFDGGPTQSVSLLDTPEDIPTTITGQTGRTQVAPTIQAPAGASTLEVWFHGSHPATAYEGECSNWDSNYGTNYTFTLAP